MESKKNARPWDIFNKNLEKVADVEIQKRLDICMSCPELIQVTNQCKKCGCFMGLKTKLANAFCPLGKWLEMPVKISE